MDTVLATSTLTHPLTTYRGLYDRPPGLVVGAEFVDAGYGSTSTDRDYVQRVFSDTGYYRAIEGDTPILMEIAVPAGTHAVEFQSSPDPDAYANEGEILLDRGTRYRVLREEVVDGRTVMHVEVLR